MLKTFNVSFIVTFGLLYQEIENFGKFVNQKIEH